MNGAESLVRTLLQNGVEVCFANPGTSEMHFVSALDRIDGMRCVLSLFEGGVTGAADGYGRMTGKPAATLLHLGPGLANGAANLHNAKRAFTPIVNIVGEHATYHRDSGAPLCSDIEGLAKTVSKWVRTTETADRLAADCEEAIAVAQAAPGGVATLILPADTAWTETDTAIPAAVKKRETPKVSDDAIAAAADALRQAGPTLLLIGGDALTPENRQIAAAIAQAADADILAPTSNGRIDRGAGTVPIERVPYPIGIALDRLSKYRNAILIGADAPVAFFAYPDKPCRLLPEDCRTVTLAGLDQDCGDALARLSDALGAPKSVPVPIPAVPPLPQDGPITPEAIGAIVGNLIPEGCIVCDESITTGRNFFASTHGAAPHSWLHITGGAIGIGIPMSTGAAVACPDRRVLGLQADGSALYTVQSLWTQARERLNVLTLIFSNRSYAILKGELANVGANGGPTAMGMLSLDNPAMDWVQIARGFGVDGTRVDCIATLIAAIRHGLTQAGPYLIEVDLP